MIKKRYDKQEILQGRDHEALINLATSYGYKFGIVKNVIITNLGGTEYTLEAGSLVRVYVDSDYTSIEDIDGEEDVRFIKQVRISSCGEFMQILQYPAPIDAEEYIKLTKRVILEIEQSIAFGEEIDKLGDNVLKKQRDHSTAFGVTALILLMLTIVTGVWLISAGVFSVAVGTLGIIILCVACAIEAMLDMCEDAGISNLFFGEERSYKLWKKYDKMLTTEAQHYLNYTSANNLDPQVVQELLAICTNPKIVCARQDRAKTLAITCPDYEPKLPYNT